MGLNVNNLGGGNAGNNQQGGNNNQQGNNNGQNGGSNGGHNGNGGGQVADNFESVFPFYGPESSEKSPDFDWKKGPDSGGALTALWGGEAEGRRGSDGGEEGFSGRGQWQGQQQRWRAVAIAGRAGADDEKGKPVGSRWGPELTGLVGHTDSRRPNC
ncbi:glycine-rich cell wall structural protein 1.0-like [Cryptomeria japonica]|uniref:glycine-rich cell wall structural protein 1.0-like n=1 Tax=Cryptomeria japonica TaxID=3369 RepID=UPI0025ACB7BF|nr:glycine-rich cell wall structural protein 1.0-like [Cryptomeria japonica]